MNAFTEFENIENIEPSEEWKLTLIEKLASVKPQFPSKIIKNNLVIFVMFVVIFNFGFILNSIISKPQKITNRNNELMLISKELLINEFQ
ncbi:MAG: hypothetical protein ACOYO1_14775 [Bacteroidales bacterium]